MIFNICKISKGQQLKLYFHAPTKQILTNKGVIHRGAGVRFTQMPYLYLIHTRDMYQHYFKQKKTSDQNYFIKCFALNLSIYNMTKIMVLFVNDQILNTLNIWINLSGGISIFI